MSVCVSILNMMFSTFFLITKLHWHTYANYQKIPMGNILLYVFPVFSLCSVCVIGHITAKI